MNGARVHACAHMLGTGKIPFPFGTSLLFVLSPQLLSEIFIVHRGYICLAVLICFRSCYREGFTSWETRGETYIAENLLPTLIGFLELGRLRPEEINTCGTEKNIWFEIYIFKKRETKKDLFIPIEKITIVGNKYLVGGNIIFNLT